MDPWLAFAVGMFLTVILAVAIQTLRPQAQRQPQRTLYARCRRSRRNRWWFEVRVAPDNKADLVCLSTPSYGTQRDARRSAALLRNVNIKLENWNWHEEKKAK